MIAGLLIHFIVYFPIHSLAAEAVSDEGSSSPHDKYMKFALKSGEAKPDAISFQSESMIYVNEVDINTILTFVEDRTKEGEAVLQKDIIEGFRGRYSKGRIL